MLFMNNCCHTYSIVLLLHYLTLMWSSSHESFQDFVHALVRHKDYINHILLSPILTNHFLSFPTKLSNTYLTIHNSFAISILSQYLKKSKLLNKPFLIVCLIWWCMCCIFMLCYFCVIVCAKSYMLSWEKWKDRDLQKAGDTHIFYLLFTTALVFFSSMHDR
jgi:hypothetical protein